MTDALVGRVLSEPATDHHPTIMVAVTATDDSHTDQCRVFVYIICYQPGMLSGEGIALTKRLSWLLRFFELNLAQSLIYSAGVG